MGSKIEQTSFLSGANATFVAELYAKYLENPDSVDPSWREFFATLHDDARELFEEMRGASWAPRSSAVVGTYGGGGHSRLLLDVLPVGEGHLIALDRDPTVIPHRLHHVIVVGGDHDLGEQSGGLRSCRQIRFFGRGIQERPHAA